MRISSSVLGTVCALHRRRIIDAWAAQRVLEVKTRPISCKIKIWRERESDPISSPGKNKVRGCKRSVREPSPLIALSRATSVRC